MTDRRMFLLELALVLGAIVLLVLVPVAAIKTYESMRLASARERFEQHLGPLDPTAYEKTPVPDADNAAIPLRAGAEKFLLNDEEERRVLDLLAKPYPSWLPQEAVAVQAILERHAAAVSRLTEAKDLCVSSYQIPYARGYAAELPDLVGLARAGQFLAANARLSLHRGRPEAALGALETLTSLAGSLEREPHDLVFLTGCRIESYQLAVIQETVSGGLSDPILLGRLEESLASVPLVDSFRRTLAAEAAFFRVQMAWVRWERASLRRSTASRLFSALFSELTFADYLDHLVETSDLLDRPFMQMAGGLEGSLDSCPLGDLAEAAHIGVSRLDRSWAIVASVSTLRSLAREAIRIRRQALRTGTYPRDIDGPAASEPLPLTRLPLFYARVGDNSALLFAGGAQELWDRNLGRGKEVRLLFNWPLPALVQAPAPSRRG